MSEGTLAERLDLLERTGVISTPVRLAVERAASNLRGRLGRSLDSSTGQMLMTHLAMAIMRAASGEAIEETSEELEDELAEFSAEQVLARAVLGDAAEPLGVTLPEAEVQLVAAYLVALRQEAP